MNNVHDKQVIYYNVIIAALAALFFIPFLGGVHLFDWDEINFAESAREMLVSKDYLTVQINFIPFWEKPPLFIWMQALSMKIFGINEFAARFPNAICGIVSLLVLFNTGRKILDIHFGALWTIFYGISLLPFLYFKSGIIDPWFNLFIFMGVYRFYRYLQNSEGKLQSAALSGLYIGLAILTKGPVALLVFAIAIGLYMLVKRFRFSIRIADVLVFTLVLTLSGGFWFILQIISGNFGIIADFIQYQIRLFSTQDAGHGGFLLYHFIVLFFGVFPASVFALPALFPSKYKGLRQVDFYSLMLILLWVVLILFTIVRTKIVHYSSLAYFPLTFIAAWAFYHREQLAEKWKKAIRITITVIGSVLALLVLLISFIDYYKDFIISFFHISDPFAIACLKADGGWRGYEFIPVIFIFAGIFIYRQLSLKKQDLQSLYGLGAGMVLFLFLAMTLIVPRVEAYSQQSAILFFKSVSHEDAYLDTKGYKSYAHLFYGKMKMHTHLQATNKDWLLKGDTDKPVYFSMKITRMEKFRQENPSIQFLYEKNGFAFFVKPVRNN